MHGQIARTGAMRGPLRKRDSRIWERHPEDWYVEPEWCSVQFFRQERFAGDIWEPSCGLGRIAIAARAAGHVCHATDLVDRGFGAQHDFRRTDRRVRVANIVSNPPFGIADDYVPLALELAEQKVAMLLPAKWVQGDKRSRWMETTPLRKVYFIAPRPSMPPGPVVVAGEAPGNGTTDYAWFVWEHGHVGAPEIGWVRRDKA
ncbi:MAG: hypothetical protein KGL35_24965 [Bradyrhizobium sp.]|nr:hypothetical protein [Bradyrhizobium sp.]